MLMPSILGLLCILSSISAQSSSLNQTEDEDVYYPATEQWSDTFDWKLLKTLSSQTKNLLISPISLKLVLALIYEGSSGNTERELRETLQFNVNKTIVKNNFKNIIQALQSPANNEYLIELGSKVFLDSKLEPKDKFRSTIHNFYNTSIEKTHFSDSANASHVINSWVSDVSHGKIKQIVSANEIQDAVMIIANALFFKGTWRHQFPKKKSYTGGFYISPTEIVNVPYMSTTDKFFYIEANELDAKILRLPYRGNRFSLFIVLPNAKGGLQELIRKINLQSLKKQLYSLDLLTIDVTIPKFKFNFQTRYLQVLQQFGVKEMFRNTASLAGIVRGVNRTNFNRRFQVSDIVQKTGIELDEEGSVIYAASEIEVGNKFGEAQHTFNATHPFLFFVEEQEQGSIIFIGKVENPLEGAGMPLPSRFGVDGQSEPEGGQAEQLTPNLQPSNPEKDSMLKRFNYFDLELLREFSESKGNVFISPASIKTTLALILEGARGKSAKEIADSLRIDNINDENYRRNLQQVLFDLNDKTSNTILESANAVFVNNKLKINPDYQKRASQYYKARVEKLDFAQPIEAGNRINSWASNATHGIIKQIVAGEYLSPDTTLLLSNALYFKGKWKTSFDAKQTRLNCFVSPTRGCVQIPFMQVSETFNYSFSVDLNAHAIELPYEDEHYSMLLLVPTNGNVHTLAKDLQHTHLNNVIDLLAPNEIILELPRFDIDYNVDLIDYLRILRIQEVFGARANLTGIVAQENVRISNIVHKTRVEVTEQGTRAAAVTSAIVIPLMGSTAQRVTADHPFVFFIYHAKSRNIIFEGIFMEPTVAYQPPATPVRAAFQQQPRYNNFQ